MFTFLLVLLVIDSLVLVTAIMLQSGKGQGLAASFGGVSSSADSLLGSRQAGNILTKTSWWGGGIFLFLSFVLSLAATRQRAPKSVLDQLAQPVQAAPAQTAPATNAGSAPAGLPLTPQSPAGVPAGTPASAPATPAPKKP
jgi:preprotein translocase subunit SecG